MELTVIFLLLLVGLVAGLVFIAKGFKYCLQKRMLRGIVFLLVGSILSAVPVCPYGFPALAYGRSSISYGIERTTSIVLNVGFGVLIVALIMTVLALSSLQSRRVKWLRIGSYVIAALLLAWYAYAAVRQMGLVLSYGGESTEAGQQAALTFRVAHLLWFLCCGASAMLVFLLPSTRPHYALVNDAMLLIVSSALLGAFIGQVQFLYLPLTAWHPNYGSVLHAVLIPLRCLMAYSLWFVFRFIVTFLQQENTRTKNVIGGLVVFYMLTECLLLMSIVRHSFM